MSDDSREFERDEANEELRELEDVKREEDEDAREEAELHPDDGVESTYNETKPIGLEDQGNDQDNDDQGVLDEDDEDEDDDDEEDEEEDRVRGSKKRRVQRNRFLDVEAEVSDDEEDEEEDDDELAKEGFIAPEHGQEDEEPQSRDDRLHRQVDRSHEKSTEEDAQKLAAQFKERYGRANKYRTDDSGAVSQRFLLPSIHDPSIWALRCRPGKEKELVKKLLKKKLTLEGKPNALQILSVFQRDNFTGYVYVEAAKLTAVDHAIKGISDIYGNNKVKVPVEEFPDLLRANKSTEVKLTPGGYVRIKRGKYKGDLAIIDSIEENGLEVTLQVVPRLDYKGMELDEETGKRKRVTSKFRPPQRLFSRKEAVENDPTNLTQRSSNTFSYKGEEYIDGFLFKLFKVQFLETQDVQPSLEEVSKFNTGDTEELDLSSIAQSVKNSSTVVFRTGDRVQVLQGEQKGLKGDVISTSNDVVLIKPISFSGGNLEFPTNNLRKIFSTGDHISVLRGKHNGHTGIVVSVQEDHVTFISDQSHKDVTVFANHLTKSTDTSTLIDGKYGLHDLVRINTTTVGVVIRADKDMFTILTQDGKVSAVSPSAIISKVDIGRDQSFATDSTGESIKKGDTVKENHGFKRQGVILHIYRSVLFIYSKETTENSGVYVSDISSVSGVASKNNFTEKEDKIDLTKMNPKFKAGGSMAPPPLPIKVQTGRDKTLNQNVSIRLGEYKGYRGIVKDTNGDIARVEFHTKNKILSISKHKLAFVDGSGRLIPYEEFINPKYRDFSQPSSGFSTPSHKAPSYTSGGSSSWSSTGSNNGGKTPAWSSFASGGKTPIAGGRTAVGAHGGAASAWGGGAGGASAWGGGAASAWGGGAAAGGASAWGGGAQSAWGGNTAGGASAWGGGAQSSHRPAAGNASAWGGGAQSAWGQGGAESTHGNSSVYGGGGSAWNKRAQHNNGGASAYGGGSAWGNNRQQGWSAATPGQAETPGAYSAETPGAYHDAETPYEAAPTPGYGGSAATPGGYHSDNE
ncbi:Transcription elongation factor [Wickerhamomyces ciferrii]|uniref:Transcription elongation factor SPT5 n=1 Tax=Wickerhamomyces ciferrii (strain ATCC 14091 / BCRC 22168 / CBS 111 / JCM 3599 / NBRC 0793 / NRRL Y-1031 F-60-10) TaxID=1206466 RepID=K0KD69_WICCF|nr:Transcription elongation factor [Wickerhamomyces ciferrii]CCH40836.1 Transcription elongation factor [Wickerhamomyces ciferrii]